MVELYTHLSVVLGELQQRNSSVKSELGTLDNKLTQFLQMQATKEDAELEQQKIIDEINLTITKLQGDLYHSGIAEEKLENATSYINDLVGEAT